jgi:hypothetical protein
LRRHRPFGLGISHGHAELLMVVRRMQSVVESTFGVTTKVGRNPASATE